MSQDHSSARLFIAIDITSSVKTNINKVIKRLSISSPPALPWVSVNNIHLTVKFLGQTPSSKINPIIDTLNGLVKEFPPFKIAISGVGAFPNVNNPRIFWIGVENNPVLVNLHKQVDISLSKQGFALEDRPYNPHLTICRVPDYLNRVQIASISKMLQDLEIRAVGEFSVNSVVLYRSDLKPGGPIYTSLFSAPLFQGSA